MLRRSHARTRHKVKHDTAPRQSRNERRRTCRSCPIGPQLEIDGYRQRTLSRNTTHTHTGTCSPARVRPFGAAGLATRASSALSRTHAGTDGRTQCGAVRCGVDASASVGIWQADIGPQRRRLLRVVWTERVHIIYKRNFTISCAMRECKDNARALSKRE